MGAILNVQYGGLTGINIVFQIPDVISFPKMYYFANHHKF